MYKSSIRKILSKKIISVFVCALFLCIAPVFASIADDAKKVMKEYAGYSELTARGFKLSMLDNIKTPEDLYKVLLPYMIVDGKPLDNDISFNDFNFKRHKSIKFKNVYGTIGELTKKGYKPEQLFYYPVKGQGIYRVGDFVWEDLKPVTHPGIDTTFYNRPVMGKNIAYFFTGAFTKNYFNQYIKEIQKKDAIVVDFRICQGGWNQIWKLGELLCKANYKGKVILIIGRNTGFDAEYQVKNLQTSYYINDSSKNIAFEWITVGENTAGIQKYTQNVKWNYTVGELSFSPLPVNKNQWACCEEGEGVNPYIWADSEEDINKTIELLTGEKDFARLISDITKWRNYLCSSGKALWGFQFRLPDAVVNLKSNEEYNKTVTELLETYLAYQDLLRKNRSSIDKIGNYWFEVPECASKTKTASEYVQAFKTVQESQTKWVNFISANADNLLNTNYWFEYPEVFKKCSSYKTYSECFSKWIDARIRWSQLNTKADNKERLNKIPVWWEFPEFFKSFKTAEQYADYFSRWIDLRIWWCNLLLDNEYVVTHNNLRVWYDALKEEIKEWKDPEKHLAEMTAYLKGFVPWIEYLRPHTYVIPKDRGMANLYGNMRRISEKIGPNCSAVPEKIRKLQKTNPEEYVNQMVIYINSVAENDFEKIKMVFDIEQLILTYDYETFNNDMKKINQAKKGVGEDYKLYVSNMNNLNKKDTEKRAQQDWKTAITTGTCVCEGYARVMQYFCYKLGIKCDLVNYPDDMIFVPGHVWNIVQIEGEDYFLDATWGQNWLFNDPESFVKGGHFPEEPEQQLMKKPMTLDEFKKYKNYKGNK